MIPEGILFKFCTLKNVLTFKCVGFRVSQYGSSQHKLGNLRKPLFLERPLKMEGNKRLLIVFWSSERLHRTETKDQNHTNTDPTRIYSRHKSGNELIFRPVCPVQTLSGVQVQTQEGLSWSIRTTGGPQPPFCQVCLKFSSRV